MAWGYHRSIALLTRIIFMSLSRMLIPSCILVKTLLRKRSVSCCLSSVRSAGKGLVMAEFLRDRVLFRSAKWVVIFFLLIFLIGLCVSCCCPEMAFLDFFAIMI